MRNLIACLKILLVFAFLGVLTACNYTVKFDGESLFNEQGQEFGRLTWDISSATDSQYHIQHVTLSPGIGEVDLSGSVDVYPSQTTTYTLAVDATRDDGTVWNTSKKVTIYIGPRVNYSLFKDTALRTCAQETKYTHIEQFKALACFGRGIKRLSGVEQLKQLTYLGIDNNLVTDFSPLQSLENLGTLSASGNGITSVASFPVLDSLHVLVLSENAIIDPSPLSALPNLDHLTLDHNQITDASTLGNFKQLTSLFLQNNTITNVSALGSLSHLEALNLASNGVRSGVASLGLLKGIFALDMRGNHDVSCLQYGTLYLVLGPALLTDGCHFP